MYTLVKNVSGNMTSLQGHLTATYQDLVEVFGEPTYSDASADGKVNTEWNMMLKDNDGSEFIATIYDWKDYDGGRRSRDGNDYDWHIGGHNRMTAAVVTTYFNSVLQPA